MTSKTANANKRQPVTQAMTRNALPLTPKTGAYVSTGGQCFNAATTDIVRGSHRAN